ncbi:NUDIX domain-containing protein [Streptomyces eurocidicus]|nr:NUDIX domain-containing protein [Streptomyces eurocidicus]
MQDFPEGAIEDGESPQGAAQRELAEETGLSATWPRSLGTVLTAHGPRALSGHTSTSPTAARPAPRCRNRVSLWRPPGAPGTTSGTTAGHRLETGLLRNLNGRGFGQRIEAHSAVLGLLDLLGGEPGGDLDDVARGGRMGAAHVVSAVQAQIGVRDQGVVPADGDQLVVLGPQGAGVVCGHVVLHAHVPALESAHSVAAGVAQLDGCAHRRLHRGAGTHAEGLGRRLHSHGDPDGDPGGFGELFTGLPGDPLRDHLGDRTAAAAP